MSEPGRGRCLAERVVEALGQSYGLPEHGGTRYPTVDDVVAMVEVEHRRVVRMHEGHHAEVVGFCSRCGMYGKSTPPASRSSTPPT